MKLFLVILCVPLLIFTSCNTDDNQGPSTPAPTLDCYGDIDGTALMDSCGTCVGGNTGLQACVQDCNGEFGGTAIIDICSNCAGGNTGLQPCVTVFQANRLNNTGQTSAWSLPTASATINFFEIEIMASNPVTNEKMVISLPNEGVGIYFSQNTFNNSTTEYIVGLDTLISVYPTNNAFTLVDITEIDNVAKTMTGTFQAGVFEPMDDTNFYIFQEGVFENVPFTE